uniref:Uncharacterized protein n=1 Tax=uncultured marine virus TaxID=186617 RepID=A0A0F7L6P0_9VIRU|nr:hypothetical protein [uncultured marine virus]
MPRLSCWLPVVAGAVGEGRGAPCARALAGPWLSGWRCGASRVTVGLCEGGLFGILSHHLKQLSGACVWPSEQRSST